MYKPLPSADMNDSIRADRLSSILERMCESIQKNVKLCTNIDFCVSDVVNEIGGYPVDTLLNRLACPRVLA